MSDEKTSKNIQSSNPPLTLVELRKLVSSRLKIIDAYMDIHDIPTFTIFPENVKEKFEKLVFDCYKIGLMPILRKDSNHFILRIYAKPPVKRGKTRINMALFIITLFTIFITGYFLWTTNELWSNILMPEASPFAQAALFTVCLISIFIVHETAHKLTCNFHRMESTLPYFIPGLFPIGTFGAVISLKSPPINRNQLFDLGISGPTAGFVATIVVCILSVLTSTIVSESQLAELGGMVGPVTWPSSPLLFLLIFNMVDLSGILHVPQGMTPVLGQVWWAAWVGSFLTFLNALPIWQLDGGHVIKAVLGSKGYKMASIVALAILISSGWVFPALFLLFLMMGSRKSLRGLEPLENISPLSPNRKIAFFILLFVTVLCFVTPPFAVPLWQLFF